MGGRILVIDDASVVLRSLVRLLRSRGHDAFGVTAAEDGLEAIAQDASIAAVMLDYSLENMNGVQLAEMIWGIRPDVPVVLMSGWDPELLEVKGRTFAGFLHKPFLVEEVERILSVIVPIEESSTIGNAAQ